MLMGDWQIEFGLSETQKGEIFGAGMWPFGVSIVLFSLFIDKLGYGKSMIFAFACHALSTVLLFTAGWILPAYWSLWLGSILNGLAAGVVEAVINPAIASAYPKEKTKWLTILHAGWPGGFVLGGIMALVLGNFGVGWRPRVFLVLIPVIAYGFLLLKSKFPPSERVAAGVSYKDMLAEAGAIGCLIVVYMVLMELNGVGMKLTGASPYLFGILYDTTFIDIPSVLVLFLMLAATVAYFTYTKSLGRWMYIFLLFVMILLAVTELGTDTWIKELMGPAMRDLKLDGGWVLVYTATIMMVLRFLIGPIQVGLSRINKVLGSPLGILLLSSLFAMAGLWLLAGATSWWLILITATVYGTGQCFFWPVTLGLVSERFPKGGALTLNAVAGVGMLGVGIIGSQMLGIWQDKSIDASLMKTPDAHTRLMDPKEKTSIFGAYKALDQKKVNEISDKTALSEFMQTDGKGVSAADLKANSRYQTLVRVAYDHNLRAEEDFTEYSHDEMEAALKEKNFFIDDPWEYDSLSKDKRTLRDVRTVAKKDAMRRVAILPLIMALCYLGLIVFFSKKMGGYEAIDISRDGANA
jgi:MFS family permease